MYLYFKVPTVLISSFSYVKSDYSHTPYALDDNNFADQQFAKNKKLIATAVSTLPTNRALLNKINDFGFSTI